ncbi:phage terminase large subunit [Sphingomonas sp. Root710]|uniref:phage terminase large subunit n=1 Tax=Sphingomonas sp. Root710 TaxID=1736594 RepID=UPI001F33F519|nr:phage terminase large subunit [Sphingomonas sp. Root710]
MTAWMLGRDPSKKIISVSYGGELAAAQTRNFQKLIEHHAFARMFPRFAIRRKLGELFETTQGGFRRSTTPNGATTGFGADIIIIDDLLKAGDVYSEALREGANTFFDQVLFSRFNNKKTGAIIAIGQRLHERDIIGHLQTKCAWDELIMPAIADERQTFETYYGRTFVREPGDTLSSAETIEVLQEIRLMIGISAFEAQYQQNPISPEGARVRWEDLPRFDLPCDREIFSRVVLSFDTATSEDPNSDFSVCLVLGFCEGQWYLLDIWRRQVRFGDLRAAALRLYDQWQPDKILIEDASSGRQLIQELCDILRVGRSKIIRIPPDMGKEERLDLASARLEDGLVAIPEEAPWLPTFKRELLGFPNAENDDQVDALTQFVRWTAMPRGKALTRKNSRERRLPRPLGGRRSSHGQDISR